MCLSVPFFRRYLHFSVEVFPFFSNFLCYLYFVTFLSYAILISCDTTIYYFIFQTPGHCDCVEGFGGSQCEACAPRYRGHPKCEPCPCDVRGIDLKSGCETNCMCKEHVEGERCDRCKPGYFALDEKNPAGCMKCYCSGVSNICHASTNLHIESVSTTVLPERSYLYIIW